MRAFASEPTAILAERRTWGLWQLKPAKPGKKPAKVPYYANGKPRSGDLDSPADLKQLVTYDEAVAAAKKLNNGHGTVRNLNWRVALMITPGLVFIDLDGHCVDGKPDRYAQTWFEVSRGATTEISQSNTGYHIVGAYSGPPVQLVDSEVGLEIYSGKRFCAWTGNMLDNSSGPTGDLVDLTTVVLDEVKPEDAHKSAAIVSNEFSGPRWDEYNSNAAYDALKDRSPACSYQEWRDTAFAIHDGFHGDDEGYEFFVAWSKGGFSDKGCPESFEERKCRSLWRSIKPGRGVTKASLFVDPPKARRKPGTPPRRKPRPAPPPNTQRIDASPGAPESPPKTIDQVPPPGNDSPEARFITTKDLKELPRRKAVFPVPGMFSTGAALLVGRPKGGKTFLATQLAHALATGGTFLGEQCIQGKTLYIAAEDTKDTFRERMLETMRLTATDDLVIVDAEGLGKIAEQYEETTLDAWVEHCISTMGITNVIIDTHASAIAIWAGENLADNRKHSPVDLAYQMTRLFENFAQRYGCLILLLHHTRKRNGKDITDFHELINLPQTVVAGCSTSVVLADHPERDAYAEEDPRRVLARRGRQGHDFVLALEFTSTGLVSRGSYSTLEQTDIQAKLLAVVEACQEGDTFVPYADIAVELGCHAKTVAGRVRQMKGTGTTTWKGKTIATKPGRAGGIRLQ